MRKLLAGVCILAFIILCVVRPARADELAELKAQMEIMRQQMAEMQRKIEKLEAERQTAGGVPQKIEERVASLEERIKDTGGDGLLSLKGLKWQLGGELEVEFVDTNDHSLANEPRPHFQLDKFVLIPKASLSEDIYLYSEIEFYSSSMLTKYGYAHFGNLPGDSFVRFGLDERFMTPSRKTERYPLAGNVFWRDNSAGVFAGGEAAPLYWRFSYTNGYEMDQRQVTEDDSLDMLHDNLRTGGYASPGEFGLGLGIKRDWGKRGRMDAMGFGYFSRLSQADETFLKDNVSGYDSGNRDKNRYGLNWGYTLGPATLFAQVIKARDGDLDRLSWYIQPSYKIRLAERDFFSAIEPVFRYGKLSVDVDAAASDPLTWDREEFTFALITDVYKNIKLKTEYTLDRLDKGPGGNKGYRELVTQLEVKF